MFKNHVGPFLDADGAGAAGPPPALATPAPEGTPAAEPATPVAGGTETPFNFPADAVDKKEAGEGKPNAEGGAVEVPETYKFTLPEGLVLKDELQQQFTKIAHEAKLTQAQADRLIEMHCQQMLAMQQQAEETKNTWVNECTKQGLTKPENLRNAKLAVDTFGGGECMQALVESGVAYNPAVQRFLQNIGSLLQEDTAPDGKSVGGKSNAEDLLFPNSKY